MKPLIDITVPVTTFLLMVAIGMELTAGDFERLRRQPALVLIALLLPPVMLPAAAVALVLALDPPLEAVAGVLLVAACPVGTVSNTYCYLARASVALSVAVTGLSSVLAALTIPATGRALTLALSVPLDLQVPVRLLAIQLAALLAVPVCIGMAARHRAPALTARLSPTLHRVAVGGMPALFALLIASDWHAFVSTLVATVPLAASFVALSVALGWTTASMLTRDRGDRFAIASEFGARNVSIATAIAVTILGRVEFARFAATYALVELPMMLVFVWVFRASQQAGSLSAVPVPSGRDH